MHRTLGCIFVCTAMALATPGRSNATALEPTPAQTEGPFYPRTMPAEADEDLTRVGAGPAAKGTPLRLSGRVVDTGGTPIANARVEIWQVDHQGIYLHPGDPGLPRRDKGFQGYGETRSGPDGAFSFRTISPPAYEGRPRHIHAKITPPGGATLTTQFYFKDDPLLARDGIARRLGKSLERVTLVPAKGPGNEQAATIDIVVRAVGKR